MSNDRLHLYPNYPHTSSCFTVSETQQVIKNLIMTALIWRLIGKGAYASALALTMVTAEMYNV